jgi:hypothetical protein
MHKKNRALFRQPEHRKWWIVLTLAMGTFTVALPFNTLPLALPKMITGLSSDLETGQWVLTGFASACAAGFLNLFGWQGFTLFIALFLFWRSSLS